MINLCCAQSVHRVVEEVARSLERLGFQVTVVCGAEARAALLGSRTDADQPTIHVVCVQGSMQERVLKPLRQALATHGGPNHHLFVAVLDLAVPLAMVGEIRRFAEALERSAPTPPTLAGTGTSREPAPHDDLEQSATRAYPAVAQVIERGGTKPPVASDDPGDGTPRRVRRLGTGPRLAKLGPTSKYRAVTASNPAATPESGVRKRRRASSRLSPSATPPAPQERVLGLPEHDDARTPTQPRRPPPRPAPAATPAASGPAPAAEPTPPPLLSRTPSSTSLPAAGAGGDPASPQPRRDERAPRPEGGAEPSRSVPRHDSGFRFSPPDVKAAEVRRAQSGPVPAATPTVELDPADRTIVESSPLETPRTASTLRLDEPPFQAGPTRPGRGSEEDEAVEPVEPTMIIMAPDAADLEGIEELTDDAIAIEPSIAKPMPPPPTGGTVVGPPPKPSPEVLAQLEQAQRAVSARAKAEPPPPRPASAGPSTPPDRGAGPRKTIGYLQRDEVVKASDAPRPPTRDAAGPDPEASRTLVQRPVGPPPEPTLSSESSGTLVLRPRTALGDEPRLEAERPEAPARSPRLSSGPTKATSGPSPAAAAPPVAGTPAKPVAGTPAKPVAGTPVKPVAGTPAKPVAGTPTEGPTGTVVQPAPRDEDFESARTLLRSDGTFESSADLMQKIKASQPSEPPAAAPAASTPSASTPAASTPPASTPAASTPPAADFKAGKTVLYADPPPRPAAAKAPEPTATATTAAATTVAATTATATTAAAPSTAATTVAATSTAATSTAATSADAPKGSTVVSTTPSSARKDPADDAAPRSRRPQSSIPTERHPQAREPEPRGRDRVHKAPPRSSPSIRAGELRSTPAPAPAKVAPPRPRPRARGSRYGWLWILLALLTAGGGWGAYQAGLLDGVLGRRRPGTEIADAGSVSREPATEPASTSPTPADGTADDAGPTTSTTPLPAQASAGPPTTDPGTEGASTSDSPDASSGTPSADSGTPSADGGTPSADGGTPSADDGGTPSDDGGTPSADGGTPSADGGTPSADDDGGTPSDDGGTPSADDDGGTPSDDGGTPSADGGSTDPPEPGKDPQLGPEELGLVAAVDSRRIFMLKTLFTTRRQGTATTFAGAWQRCAKLEVDGVKGWRLPHRREMKLVNAVLSLPAGAFWTRTVPDDDKSAAYVLDTTNGQLSLFLKQEPSGEVICVRPRQLPEK